MPGLCRQILIGLLRNPPPAGPRFMKTLTAVALLGTLFVVAVETVDSRTAAPDAIRIPLISAPTEPDLTPFSARPTTQPISEEALTGVVKKYCTGCHNAKTRNGNISLDAFDVAAATATPEVAEKMVNKLRSQMMPPPGSPRPAGDTLVQLYETLEKQ